MNTVKVQKNQVIAQQRDKVKNWYILLEGSVIQKNSLARIVLAKNAVIGMSEDERYMYDYIAGTDCILAEYPYETPDALKNIIEGQASMRETLIRAAVNQRQQLLKTYAGFQNLVRQFHFFVENQYNEYTNFCIRYETEGMSFPRIVNLKPLEMEHRAESWEINNSTSLVQGYLEEYIQLMQKDDALCIGAIMEACRQTKRVSQGIIEMVEHLKYSQDILLDESSNDLFYLYFDLLLRADRKQCDVKPLSDSIGRMADLISKIGLYDNELVTQRINEYKNYITRKAAGEIGPASDSAAQQPERELAEEDYLTYILDYAELEKTQEEEFLSKLKQYRELPDMQSSEGETYQLRRYLTRVYYEIYSKVFLKTLEDAGEISPIIKMFMNFGFMDMQMVGREKTAVLYQLAMHLETCNSSNVYTIYTWLQSVYEGKNEPSKNELDLDYPGYLAEMRKTGQMTAEQAAAAANDRNMKLQFELENMFPSGNRTTYGKISTFCPILSDSDLINSAEKMLVTVQRLEEALDKIKEIDFSVFYREIAFSDPVRGINREMIQKEVLPDIILMPNAGTRAMMWQEIAGSKRNTPARFMFPIFTAVDLDDMMTETVGRYRWEICRRIQGVHWNDIRDRSLTSEYCDYIQFYRKNSELSADAKEKIKLALQRGRNNYREVFVKDYQNWLKYESKGSFRLNKIAREILLRYCPFSKPIREYLKSNPVYQNAWNRFELQNTKALQRMNALLDKYQKSGGQLTPDLQEHLEYYKM